MQRINLWPNPKFDPTGFHVVQKGGDISKCMAGGTAEYPSAQTVGKYTIRFTPIANDTRLAVPSGMAISELSVEAADTYDAALGGGLPGFFSGDTMPRD